jgi:predicted DsbA family dithiol-disulfide isomerase
MHIEIISDTVCPWCYIGKRRFERAVEERPDLNITLSWRPFQLNPNMPRAGMDLHQHVTEKFGGEEAAREVYESIRIVGDTEDLPFAFDLVERMPNTIDSHRLIRWSASANLQDAVVEKLFQRYFFEGADIGDAEILLDIADEVGLDTDVIADLLEGDQDRDVIVEENKAYQEMGVTGVPCFIVDRKYVVMGAQEPETFLQLFEKIEAQEDEEAHDGEEET